MQNKTISIAEVEEVLKTLDIDPKIIKIVIENFGLKKKIKELQLKTNQLYERMIGSVIAHLDPSDETLNKIESEFDDLKK